MISIQEIEKLATLARINLPDAEKESLRKDIDSILGYVDQIKKAHAEAQASSKEKPDVVLNVMREDGDAHESGLYSEELLAAAPQREGNYVKVKKIL